jgi:uncharacterized phage-associated protein
MSLGITRNQNGALLAYIADAIPGINLRKLLKIVYMIDAHFVEVRNFPLTWFDYFAWAKGPVAPEVYNIKNGAFAKYVTAQRDDNDKWIISSRYHGFPLDKQMEEFSPYELSHIDMVINQCKDKTADELSDMTHEEGELWSTIVKENNIAFVDGKSEVPIPLIRLLDGQPDRQEVYDEALWMAHLQVPLKN